VRTTARFVALLAAFSAGGGCGDNDDLSKPKKAEVVRTIALSGFDPAGEPQIRVLSDGSLRIDFEFMPPSWAPEQPVAAPGDPYPALNLGRFYDFDKQLERALDVPVHWEDREFFIIWRPKQDTIDRLARFLEQYPRK
jgi:hypothetical protein